MEPSLGQPLRLKQEAAPYLAFFVGRPNAATPSTAASVGNNVTLHGDDLYDDAVMTLGDADGQRAASTWTTAIYIRKPEALSPSPDTTIEQAPRCTDTKGAICPSQCPLPRYRSRPLWWLRRVPQWYAAYGDQASPAVDPDIALPQSDRAPCAANAPSDSPPCCAPAGTDAGARSRSPPPVTAMVPVEVRLIMPLAKLL